MIAVYALFAFSLGYKTLDYFNKKKRRKETDALIDELDEMYEEMKESRRNINLVEIIKQNQVEFAKELNEERQNTL